jgi:citrate synthase
MVPSGRILVDSPPKKRRSVQATLDINVKDTAHRQCVDSGGFMSDTAKLILDGNEHNLDVIVGSEGEHAIDIRELRNDTGYITLDSGYGNTGSTTSSITYLDGEQGILRYRGIPIEQLAEKSSFVETAYLLIYGELPNKAQLDRFSEQLTYHSMIHEGMRHFFHGYPQTSHPMAILSSMVCSLSAYYPDCLDANSSNHDLHIARLLSKVRTIAAFGYKHSVGQPLMYPRNELGYCANFLHMMFALPTEPYEADPEMVKAINMLLILHADHEQNCSTSTVRLVGSSNANLYASISAGILALWGPLHGGANQAVIEMLEEIRDMGVDYKGFMNVVKDKESGRRLMGFGHRVYKNYDPRAKLLKGMADRLLVHLGLNDPLLDIAKNLEEIALADDYFVERKLYPNVDFYSGVVYKALGIPTNMFTVMFALGRLPGWIAHWREMMLDPKRRIGRPRQIYTGECVRDYVPMDQRQQ